MSERSLDLDRVAALDLVMRNAVPPHSAISVGFQHETGNWYVLAEVATEGARKILLTPAVMDRQDLDWPSLLLQLGHKTRECFADPAGCALLVERDPKSPFGFTILHEMPEGPGET